MPSNKIAGAGRRLPPLLFERRWTGPPSLRSFRLRVATTRRVDGTGQLAGKSQAVLSPRSGVMRHAWHFCTCGSSGLRQPLRSLGRPAIMRSHRLRVAG